MTKDILIKKAIETRLWAKKRRELWEREAQEQTSTPQMCLERELASSLARVELASEEILRCLGASTGSRSGGAR